MVGDRRVIELQEVTEKENEFFRRIGIALAKIRRVTDNENDIKWV